MFSSKIKSHCLLLSFFFSCLHISSSFDSFLSSNNKKNNDNNNNNEYNNKYESENVQVSGLSSQVEKGPCNIPVETSPISQKKFLEKYAFNSPVVFRRSEVEPKRNAAFQQKSSFSNLITEYGNKFVTVSTANTHSYKKYSMRLDEYLSQYVLSMKKNENYHKLKYGNETWYFFGENNYTEWKPLLDLYEMPKYKLPLHEPAYSFGIAVFYSGARSNKNFNL